MCDLIRLFNTDQLKVHESFKRLTQRLSDLLINAFIKDFCLRLTYAGNHF